MERIRNRGWTRNLILVVVIATVCAATAGIRMTATEGADPIALAEDGGRYVVDTVKTSNMPFAFIDLATMDVVELTAPLEDQRSEKQIMAAAEFFQEKFREGSGGLNGEHTSLKAVYVTAAVVDSQGSAGEPALFFFCFTGG